VKVESFNPGGSVKDRLALAIVLDAEARGLLKPGDTIVEATSGNTGVALAAVAAARGYKFVATMVETFSIERRKLMRAYGAKVILTPAAERGTGMVRRAEELAEAARLVPGQPVRQPGQSGLPPQTTAAEILRDFAGKRLDYFVSGWGTGGTLTGVGEVLQGRPAGSEDHRHRTGRRIAAQGRRMEAAQDPGLDPGLRARSAQPRGLRPTSLPVTDDDAIATARRLAGAGRHLRRHLRRRHAGRAHGKWRPSAPAGSVLLAMLPDTGERYFSTPLFADVNEGSDDEWLASLLP
jgi:cysteine synthase A